MEEQQGSSAWLPAGCCAGCPPRHRCQPAEKGAIGSIGAMDGGGGIRLRGSLVVVYAPAGKSCLLRLVGHVTRGGLSRCGLVLF